MKNFVEELKWRGMIHDIMPGTEEELMKGPGAAYVGIDPTGDSLHIGHLVSIMILKHFQACGHKPYALVGGATMRPTPSGTPAERAATSFASSTPSGFTVFIFQLPATIFFLMFFIF